MSCYNRDLNWSVGVCCHNALGLVQIVHQIARPVSLRIWLPVSHTPSCIGATTRLITSLNPLINSDICILHSRLTRFRELWCPLDSYGITAISLFVWGHGHHISSHMTAYGGLAFVYHISINIYIYIYKAARRSIVIFWEAIGSTFINFVHFLNKMSCSKGLFASALVAVKSVFRKPAMWDNHIFWWLYYHTYRDL